MDVQDGAITVSWNPAVPSATSARGTLGTLAQVDAVLACPTELYRGYSYVPPRCSGYCCGPWNVPTCRYSVTVDETMMGSPWIDVDSGMNGS